MFYDHEYYRAYKGGLLQYDFQSAYMYNSCYLKLILRVYR